MARLRSGLGALPATHETRPMVLTTLAAMLHNQYLQREDPALLDESARLIDEAAATVPPDSPLYAQIHAARDMMSAAHPASQNDPGKLDQAIAAARARLEAAPHGHPDHPQAVLQLGMAMAVRFSVTRVADSLDETTDLLREAVATAPPDWPQLPALRTMLASVLSEVAIRDGNLAESAEAIDLLRAELPGLDPKNPLASVLHGSLAVAVWHRYVATEEPGLLTEAIDEGRIALGLVTGDSPARAPLLHNLGNALNDLYRRTGDLAALDEAITLSRRAELTISGAGRAIAMNSLATSLILRHQRTDDADTANEAVTWGRRAVEAAGKGHPDRLTYVVTLAQALEARSSCAGHQADLQETIDLLRQTAHVVAIREHTDQDLQYVANALASALLKRSTSDPDLPAVEEALSWLRRATAGRAQSSARDRCLGLLGKALQRRYELTRDRGALAEALAAFTAAANPDLSPTLAVFRNVERGRTSAALLDWPLALEALGAAIEGLPLMAARHLDRADQEHALTLLSGLAADAAAAALSAGRPDRAAELLERGRGVLLTQTLQTRGDLDELGDRDPQLAARLAAVRDQLDAVGRSEPDPARRDQQSDDRRAGLRRRLASEWDDLVADVRGQGFDDFLRPTALTDLTRIADEGPVTP